MEKSIDWLVREKLTNEISIKILSLKFPELSLEDCKKLDEEGRRCWQYDAERAYYCKVIAAAGYFDNFKKSEKSEDLGLLEKSACNYDKAAKDALLLGFPMAAIRCRIRSSKLWCWIYNSEDKKEDKSQGKLIEYKRSLIASTDDILFITKSPEITAKDLEIGSKPFKLERLIAAYDG